MSFEDEPMEVDEIPFNNDDGAPTDGAMTHSPCHVNTGVYSGHPGLQAFLTLGVPINAPLSAIKSAYRKLAREYHPDRLKGVTPDEKADINEKFSHISHAYDLLTHAYSEYTGEGGGENYPVFFGTPGSLDSQTPPREADPYELYRQNAAWSKPNVPLALPYEAQPPPLPPQAYDDSMEQDVPIIKRAMDDDDMEIPRQKRPRTTDYSFRENAAPVMSNGNWGVKRDANEAGRMDFVGNPAAKKRRTAY